MKISSGMIFLIVLFALVEWTNSASCPSYKRFSQNHSFCKPRNEACKFIKSGLNDPKQIDLILNLHNVYRNRVAMGNEHLAGGMPMASNMMQMEWDPELAAVAQKWAENCVYEHDCSECRQVENFAVGQNIAYNDFWCIGRGGFCRREDKNFIPDWEKIIKLFYDEVVDFNNQDISSYQTSSFKEIGHFTQMIWANSWRLGCGYSMFRSGRNKRHFFVCNYGPTGNIINKPIYRPGKPCSECPINTCCGDNCQGEGNYEGLCKMLNTQVAPIYPPKAEGLLFSCSFEPENKFCAATVTGTTTWTTKSTLSGNIESIKLKGGQESHLHFTTMIRPDGVLCLRIQFRKGPAVAGRVDRSLLSVTIEDSSGSSFDMDLDITNNDISSYSLDLSRIQEMKFTINYSVPSGGYAHILDIKDIVAFSGICEARKTDADLGLPV